MSGPLRKVAYDLVCGAAGCVCETCCRALREVSLSKGAGASRCAVVCAWCNQVQIVHCAGCMLDVSGRRMRMGVVQCCVGVLSLCDYSHAGVLHAVACVAGV